MIGYEEVTFRNDRLINGGRPYQQCAVSVLDTIADPDIRFDEKGISNYYHHFLEAWRNNVFIGKVGEQKLEEIVTKIKDEGKGKRYDCITGVSGGVDSTYLALQAKKLGLRPLIVHFDNGWNSELAVKNIENIISKLGFDLYTLVVNWEEFKDIQMAYLRASVVDIEAITDHAIIGTLYKLASENDIKYILNGANIVTEYVLPRHWIWNKYDHVNIKAIHDQFGKLPLKTFPFFNTRQKQYYIKVKGIHNIYLLNYFPYDKKLVKETIIRELEWRDYGGKHCESVFTRFYQGYILPVKFGIDKRKAHLSNLVFAGQISKREAMEELAKPMYEAEQLRIDYEFVLKKFGLSEKEFRELIRLPRHEHNEFSVEKSVWDKYALLKPFKGIREKFNKKS